MNALNQGGLRSRVGAGWRVGAIVLGLCVSSLAQAALISRAITVDGTLTDWTTPTNILTNPGQFSTDCDGTIAPGAGGCDLDYSVGSTGRDLKKFSFTWDTDKLYLYVERFASTSNQTDWWFYIDTDADGLMEADEPLAHVDWTGSNRKTNVEVCPYFPSNTLTGDPLTLADTADGYDMPGSTSGPDCVSQYNGFGGSSAGVEMEIELTWSSLGATGVQNMGFHISSSNGTNIPTQIKDNMNGPGGNSLFPSNLFVTKIVSSSPVNAASTLTYTIVLANDGITNGFTDVVLEDFLPADIQYVSSTPHAGTTFTDSDSDTVPDTWTVGTVNPGDVLTLTVDVQAANVTAPVTRTNTATIISYTGNDSNTANNASSVDVTINPAPQLTVDKTVSQTTANPSDTVRYTVSVTNTGYADAANVVVIDDLDRLTPFRVGTFSGQNIRLLPATSPMAIGTPTYEDHQGTAMTPSSGNNAPAGYDGDVGEIRIPLTGTLPGASANFTLEYDVLVR